MNSAPLVTIVINNHNYARFLGEAIDSALAQTYAKVEVVVVDDGSTDESREVIKRYGWRVIPILKENGGQGSAYNSGFQASHGEAICFLDADDALSPTAMELASAMLTASQASKVQWPLLLTDAAGNPTGALSTRSTPPDGDLLCMVTRDGPFYDWYLTTGALYARWALQRVLPVPESEYRLGSDEYLTTLAPVLGCIKNIPQALGTYRNHGGNNYAGQAIDDEKLRGYMRRFEANCRALQAHLRLRGVQAEIDDWKRRNFNYVWPERLLRAKCDIARLVPERRSYILINDDEWGQGEPVPGRRMVRFVERDGHYGGPPRDDDHALRELTRLRDAGATVVFFWWTAFWWLEHYSGFAQYLHDNYRCMLASDHLIAFDLTGEINGMQSVSSASDARLGHT